MRSEKVVIIEGKGERLAENLGTKWYNEGKKSTKYFLRIPKRQVPEKLGKLEESNGEVTMDEEEIEREIIDLFWNLYETYKTNIDVNDDPIFFNEMNPISGESENLIEQQIEVDDLWKTLRTWEDSAPGRDGISYLIIAALREHFGTALKHSWDYSLFTGKLMPSHKVSFLRLILKAGKDPKRLTNWRPITPSNCDHKLITKMYLSRICEEVSAIIKARQTAYLKGGFINDNVRSLIVSINVANLEANVDGLIVSLDANKAFDSVKHSYIEKCIESFGLKKFVPVFKA